MDSLEPMMKLMLHAEQIDEIAAIKVGAGCYRRDLCGTGGVRVWVVDMEPGSQWPYVDDHDTGEHYYVVQGEIIEGDMRFGAGTYVRFAPDSQHQPKTDSGVRLFGFNLDRPTIASQYGGATSRAGRLNYSQG